MSEVPLYLSCGAQGHLARKKEPHPLGPPEEPRHGPIAGSYGVAVSYERGTPLGFRVQSSESRVSGFGFREFRFRVLGLGCRVCSSG